MANNENLGFEHRFAFGASPHTFDSSSQRFEVVSTTKGKQSEILDAMGLLGSRTRREDRTRAGLIRVEKNINYEMSPRILDWHLPFILGAAESTDTFNVADSLSGFDMLHDPFGTGSNATKFSELYVNRATIDFRAGMLGLGVETIGKTATTGQTFTSAALGSTAAADAPYVFYDTASGFTIQSGAIEIEEATLVIDNVLDVKFRNSQTAVSIRPTDRIVSLVTNIPLTPTTWGTYFGDKSAVDATLVITNGTVTTTFTLFNLKNPDEWPDVGGKGEVPLILRSAARGDASDPDLRVTVVGSSL